MSPWRANTDIARVDSAHRVVVLDLTRPDQPPVILEGSALLVYEAADGTRDTDAIIDLLSREFPEVHGLEGQVRECLSQLADVGLVSQVAV